MNLTDEQRRTISDKMNEFPEVAWDRSAGEAIYGVAYGWIDRDDGRSDFMVLHWWQPTKGAPLEFGMTTSSAQLSEEFTRRIDPGLEHAACERVEDEFPAVQRKIRL